MSEEQLSKFEKITNRTVMELENSEISSLKSFGIKLQSDSRSTLNHIEAGIINQKLILLQNEGVRRGMFSAHVIQEPQSKKKSNSKNYNNLSDVELKTKILETLALMRKALKQKYNKETDYRFHEGTLRNLLEAEIKNNY